MSGCTQKKTFCQVCGYRACMESDDAPPPRKPLREEVARLRAEIENLARERDGWVATAARHHMGTQAATAEAARLRDEVAGVLKPFASAHDDRPDINDTHPDYDKQNIWESSSAISITFGHLREAAALLSSLNPPAQPEEAGE